MCRLLWTVLSLVSIAKQKMAIILFDCTDAIQNYWSDYCICDETNAGINSGNTFKSWSCLSFSNWPDALTYCSQVSHQMGIISCSNVLFKLNLKIWLSMVHPNTSTYRINFLLLKHFFFPRGHIFFIFYHTSAKNDESLKWNPTWKWLQETGDNKTSIVRHLIWAALIKKKTQSGNIFASPLFSSFCPSITWALKT